MIGFVICVGPDTSSIINDYVGKDFHWWEYPDDYEKLNGVQLNTIETVRDVLDNFQDEDILMFHAIVDATTVYRNRFDIMTNAQLKQLFECSLGTDMDMYVRVCKVQY